MSCATRIVPGGVVFHVLNRANARAINFEHDDDFMAFERVMAQTIGAVRMQILAYLMETEAPLLSPWSVERPGNWAWRVNQPETDEELNALRESARRGRPFGSERRQKPIGERLVLESTVRLRGRPTRTQRRSS